MKKWAFSLLGLISFLAISFFTFVWLTTKHYADIESVEINCPVKSPQYSEDRPLKVLSWNIEFLAGKNYVFFYEGTNGSGKDEAPSSEDVQLNLQEVVRIIKDENPDFVLLQEVDVDAKRTGHQDQVKLLLQALNPLFPCSTSTYYWRAGFAPHPHIMGSVGMKLATFSKFRIEKAQRLALGEFPSNFIDRQFRPKRALLDATIATTSGAPLRILNTHLEAYSQGSDLMQFQVHRIREFLESLDEQSTPWLLGGDFNLLMPGRSLNDLSPTQRRYYREPSEFADLAERFHTIPSREDINGEQHEMWYTHYPNDPEVKGPDRTIDYLIYSTALSPRFYRVRSRDTQKISDHLPLIAEFSFTAKSK